MKCTRGSVTVVAAALLAAGCSPGSEPTDTSSPETVTVTFSSSTSNAPSTTTVTRPPRTADPTSSSTTATPEPSGTSTTPAPAPPPEDDRVLPTGVAEYADGFVRAWGAGDRSKAARYASSETVGDLFGTDSLGGTTWQRQGTSDEGSRTRVSYADASGRTLSVIVDEERASAGDLRAVVGAVLGTDGGSSPSPTSEATTPVGLPEAVTDYTDALVRAWGKDDISAWDYATDEAMAILYADYGSGGPRWSRRSSTATTVTYRNADGSVLVLEVDPDKVAAGDTDAVIGATFS